MAQLMTDEQRLKALEAYDPREHLISVGTNKDRTPVLYYPAAWRLYELRLRHPHFVLEAEIIHMDEERGSVIVKAIGYDGLNYESSTLKGTALKQGRLADLDKVETKAKSRVARDIGIGTEYALDMDADETDAQHAAPTTQPVQHKQQAGNAKQQTTAAQSLKVVKPAAQELDPAEVSLYVGGVFKFQSSDFEKRWTAYKLHVLGEARADADLSQSDLTRLRTFAADEDKREKAHAAKTPTNGAKAS